MTPKQKFIETFLKHVYGFDDVEFEGTCSKCMSVKGINRVHVEFPARCLFVKSKTETETTQVWVWVDANRTTGYTVKFKTAPIPKSEFEDIKAKAEYLWPGARASIYNRTRSCGLKKEIPTLRLRVSRLPWK